MQLHHGPNAGRILFSGQSDSNNGSVVIFSDTQGSSWDWSPDLHLPGNDETSLAETSTGGVMAIMRNCITKNGSNPDPRRGTPDDCVGPSHRFNAAWSTVRPAPPGTPPSRLQLSAVLSFRQDGGSTFGEIRSHPDLVTPGCEGSLLSYRGAIIFAGPYSTLPGTAVANPGRHNGTVLVSVDDGVRLTDPCCCNPPPLATRRCSAASQGQKAIAACCTTAAMGLLSLGSTSTTCAEGGRRRHVGCVSFSVVLV